jgi:hypothetical protein
MKGLCKYKDIFGRPNEGAHSIRIFGFAAVDIILTILAAFLIAKFTKIGAKIGVIYVTLALFLLGIFIHYLFCVDTKLNRCLGLTR